MLVSHCQEWSKGRATQTHMSQLGHRSKADAQELLCKPKKDFTQRNDLNIGSQFCLDTSYSPNPIKFREIT